MTINFEDESGICLDVDREKTADSVIRAALDNVNCPYEAEVNLLITDGKRIREMNREYRQIDRETDVLSFPMLEYQSPGDFSFLEEDGRQSDCFNPDTGELLLGDIVISAERVISQAQEYGHSQEREFGFLIAHSMLHLCGFDHMQEQERDAMEERQRQIMDAVGISRSRD